VLSFAAPPSGSRAIRGRCARRPHVRQRASATTITVVLNFRQRPTRRAALASTTPALDLRSSSICAARPHSGDRKRHAAGPCNNCASREPLVFRGNHSLFLSQTNRIIKLPATTTSEIESLDFRQNANFPARAWHVRARPGRGVVRGIRSIERGGVAPVR
jgi:hypothetical protein